MPHDPEKYLYDMLEASCFLLEFTAGRSLDNYKGDKGFRSAVERQLLIIGEALTTLDKFYPQIAQQISEYQRIIRFRHILVHGYDIVDHDVVWNILQNKLPVLRTDVERLLGEEDKKDKPQK